MEFVIPMEDEAKSTSGNNVRPGSLIDEKVSPDIWGDSLTPILSDGNGNHDIYMSTGIGAPVEYCKMIHFLGMVPTGDTVRIHLNTPGGDVDSAFEIVDAIKKCRGIIVAVLNGSVASAGTIIALSCDLLEVGQYVHWLSHNYSSGVGGKGHEIKAQAEFMDRELNIAFRDIHLGFFSEQEMDAIIDGKDRWLNRTEVMERWASRQETRKVS